MAHPLWSNLFRRPPAVHAELARMWRETPLFAGIAEAGVQRLVGNMHPRDYGADEKVFGIGDRGAGAVLIYSGGVAISVGGRNLAQLLPGDFFGEIALTSDEPRTADAMATQATQLVFLLRADVEEWIERSPVDGARFSLNLAAVTAARLREANRQLVGL